jgi:hypothetical protein
MSKISVATSDLINISMRHGGSFCALLYKAQKKYEDHEVLHRTFIQLLLISLGKITGDYATVVDIYDELLTYISTGLFYENSRDEFLKFMKNEVKNIQENILKYEFLNKDISCIYDVFEKFLDK